MGVVRSKKHGVERQAVRRQAAAAHQHPRLVYTSLGYHHSGLSGFSVFQTRALALNLKFVRRQDCRRHNQPMGQREYHQKHRQHRQQSVSSASNIAYRSSTMQPQHHAATSAPTTPVYKCSSNTLSSASHAPSSFLSPFHHALGLPLHQPAQTGTEGFFIASLFILLIFRGDAAWPCDRFAGLSFCGYGRAVTRHRCCAGTEESPMC
jgi:hypothetical protein